MYVTLTQGIECRPGISLPGRRSKRGRGEGGTGEMRGAKCDRGG